MSLSALTLSVSSGVRGRPFSATISGKSAGSTLDVVQGFTEGFWVVNGRVEHSSLAHDLNTVVIRETLPGTGTRDTSLQIAGYSVDNPAPDPSGTTDLANGATVSVTNALGAQAHDGTAAVTGNTLGAVALAGTTAMVDHGQALVVPVTGTYVTTATVSVAAGVVTGIALS